MCESAAALRSNCQFSAMLEGLLFGEKREVVIDRGLLWKISFHVQNERGIIGDGHFSSPAQPHCGRDENDDRKTREQKAKNEAQQ